MFINLKINLKLVITILGIAFAIFFIFFSYKFILNNKSKSDNLIIMNTENYTNILKEIHNFPDNYIGKSIETSGFIFRNTDFTAEEFVVSRNMVVCCPSDAIIVGFLCKYEDGNKYEDNCWVKVNGTIEIYEKYNSKLPIIKVQNISKLKPPQNTNVLPPTI